jgi:hypothetical protein
MQALGGFDLEKPRKDKEGRYSLNDIYKMAGSPSHQEPSEWVRLEGTKALVEVLQDQQVPIPVKTRNWKVLETKRGQQGGTWATRGLVLAYAKYLSPEFHASCLKVIEERIEEMADPELGITRARERASKMWKRTGKGNAWIVARLDGIDTRNTFTSACAERGVKDYKLVTNGVYTGLFGKTARELRVRMGLPDGANVRDAMDETQLIATRLAENLTIRKAQEQKLWGDGEIADAANHCGRGIQTAIRAALSAA